MFVYPVIILVTINIMLPTETHLWHCRIAACGFQAQCTLYPQHQQKHLTKDVTEFHIRQYWKMLKVYRHKDDLIVRTLMLCCKILKKYMNLIVAIQKSIQDLLGTKVPSLSDNRNRPYVLFKFIFT